VSIIVLFVVLSLLYVAMMSMKKKQIYRLGMMALVASLFFSHTRVFALNQFSVTSFSDSLFDKMSAVGSVKDIVTTYCSTVLGASAFEKNDFVYDGKQSAFVHLLCSNVAGQSSSFF